MNNNRYLLFLNNNYSNEKYCIELENVSCEPDKYVFEDVDKALPADFPYGVYDYALVRCAGPYEVVFMPCLLDTVIKADGVSFCIRRLRPETGMLEFRPDDERGPVWDTVEGEPRLYLDE